MTVPGLLIFDGLLLTSIVGLAWAALASRDERRSVILLAWLILVAVSAVYPVVISQTGQLSANALPVLLGVILSLLVLPGARHLPLHISARRQQRAARDFTPRVRRRIRHLARTAEFAAMTLKSGSRDLHAKLRQSIQLRLTATCRSKDTSAQW